MPSEQLDSESISGVWSVQDLNSTMRTRFPKLWQAVALQAIGVDKDADGRGASQKRPQTTRVILNAFKTLYKTV